MKATRDYEIIEIYSLKKNGRGELLALRQKYKFLRKSI
jgi:hypothetical protein